MWDLDTFYVFSHFCEDQSDLYWVDTITDTGTVTYGDNHGGVALLDPSDATVADNDEAYLASSNEVFLIQDKTELYFRARISYQEQGTDDANVAMGFANAVAADLIVDDGAGLRASGTIIAVEKRDGETTWRLTTRNGSTVNTTLSTTTAGVSNDLTLWQDVEIFVHDYDNTVMVVAAKVDGAVLRDSNNIPIRHFIAVASATEMQAFVGVKNGGANNELLYVDYIYAHGRIIN